MQLINSAHQQRFKRVEPSSVRAFSDSIDVVVRESRLFSDGDVMTPFVLGAAQPAHSQDNDLSFSRLKRGLGEHVAREHQPAFEKLRMPSESRTDIVDVPVTSEAL